MSVSSYGQAQSLLRVEKQRRDRSCSVIKLAWFDSIQSKITKGDSCTDCFGPNRIHESRYFLSHLKERKERFDPFPDFLLTGCCIQIVDKITHLLDSSLYRQHIC